MFERILNKKPLSNFVELLRSQTILESLGTKVLLFLGIQKNEEDDLRYRQLKDFWLACKRHEKPWKRQLKPESRYLFVTNGNQALYGTILSNKWLRWWKPGWSPKSHTKKCWWTESWRTPSRNSTGICSCSASSRDWAFRICAIWKRKISWLTSMTTNG